MNWRLICRSPTVSDCGRYLIITPQKTVKNNLVYFSDLNKTNRVVSGKLELVPVITELEADYEVSV